MMAMTADTVDLVITVIVMMNLVREVRTGQGAPMVRVDQDPAVITAPILPEGYFLDSRDYSRINGRTDLSK